MENGRMEAIRLKQGAARWDEVSLGEVMLRLDPGEGRIHTARQFAVWEGGGEYNVARGLRRCFGLKTAVATALADNAVGRLVEDLILQGGVDTSLLRWVPYDGVGRAARNGLNFTERGLACARRRGVRIAGTRRLRASQPGDWDWDEIFGPGRTGNLGRGGFIRAEFLRRCRSRRLGSPARRWMRRGNMGRRFPMT